jgi:PAS domain S-box-containing protein
MGRVSRGWLLALVVYLSAFGSGDDAAAQGSQKRVLVLHSARREAQLTVTLESRLPSLLESGLPEGLDYYSEYIDQARFQREEYPNAFRDFLQQKYQGQHIDAIIPVGNGAIEFLSRNRETLFAGTPIVFYTTVPPSRPMANSTGIVNVLRFDRSVDLALTLQPDLRHLFVVSGAAPADQRAVRQARAEFGRFEGRLQITYLSGLVSGDLEARLRALPPRSAVFFTLVSQDGRGERLQTTEYLARVASVANAPTYSWADVSAETGIVGGYRRNQLAQTKALADLTLRVLRGQRAGAIPVSSLETDVMQIDWRQLRRWGISEARVPAGTSVLYREPTLFEEYGLYIIGAICLIAAESALVGGLVIHRRRRRRAEESLRESEQHFRMMADTAPVMVWRSGPDKLCDFFNEPWLVFRGRTLEQERGNGWTEGVHAEDREYCIRRYVDAFERREPFRMEYRLRRADGEYRWVLNTGVPRRSADGSFSGYIGSCIDITDRKMMEATLQANEAKLRSRNEEIRDLAGRLITAQEAERSRIARELHDDIGQQVALITIELALLSRTSQDEAVTQTGEVLRRVQGLAKSVQDLSHRLHPARLRLLGLVSALEALRNELSKYGTEIRFTHENIPSDLPADLTLCLFRVVQEGLQNALKHGKAQRVSVDLKAGPGALSLTIRDDGRGFDTDGALGRGLGLVSMHERLDAIGGLLEIRSIPGAGTELNVTVLFGAQTTATGAPKVLLVDDNDAMLARASDVLTPACAVAGKVRTGAAALEAAEILRPDVIVLDISMPDMTGFEVAARLRQTGSTAAIVFLTVHDDDEYLQAARAAGAVGYIAKSRLASDLLPAVHEARTRRRLDSVIH